MSKILLANCIDKPLNVVLNCRFQNGEYAESNLHDPLMVYRDEDKNDHITIRKKLISQNENQKIDLNQQQPQSIEREERQEINEQKPYPYQRKLEKRDGLLYLYSKNENKEETNIQIDRGGLENIIPIQDKNIPNNFNVEKVQMLCCVTMYNEDIDSLLTTLAGIQNNLKFFEEMGLAQEQIVVVVIQDGILKMNNTIKDYFEESVDKPYFKQTIKDRIKLIIDEQNFYKNNNLSHKIINEIPPSIPKKVALIYQTQFQVKGKNKKERLEDKIKNLQDKIKDIDKRLIDVKKKRISLFQEEYKLNQDIINKLQKSITIDINERNAAKQQQQQNKNANNIQPAQQQFDKEASDITRKNLEIDINNLYKTKRNYIIEQKDNLNNYYQQLQLRKMNSEQKINLIKKKINDLNLNLPKNSMEKINKKEIIKKGQDQSYKLSTFFVLKHLNGKKLSSHMWFFQGFCRQLKPKYCVLVDCGTMPDKLGLVNFYKAMECDPNLGGVSGYMGLYFDKQLRIANNEKEENNQFNQNFQKIITEKQLRSDGFPIADQNYISKFFNLIWKIFINFHDFFDVRKAQLFEYTIAHILDKNFESLFGFLHVLPGAWSSYRYSAMAQSQQFRMTILEKKYLKTALNPDKEERDYQEANMFLAEDRILSLGIFAQKDFRFTLKYVPNAEANTDAVDTFTEFLGQRRRWINSSWFALNYVLINYFYFMKDSKHPFYRKLITIPFTMLMAWLGKLNAWFLISFYYFAVHLSADYVIKNKITDLPDFLQPIPGLFPFFYVFLLSYLTVASLIFKPQGKYNQFSFISSIIGLYQIGMMVLVIYNVINNYLLQDQEYNTEQQRSKEEQDVITTITWIMIVINVGCFVLIILLHPHIIFDILKSVVSYIYYQATYTHTMLVYAFCNVDDVTWGTKGIAAGGDLKYKRDKVQFVAQWIVSNAIGAYVLLVINNIWGRQGYVLIAVGLYSSANLLIKFVCAFLNRIYYFFDRIYIYCKIKQYSKMYTRVRDKIRQLFPELNQQSQIRQRLQQ